MKGRKVKKPEWRRKYKTQIRTSSSVSCFLLSNRRIYVMGPTCRAMTWLCSQTCGHFARARTYLRTHTGVIGDKPLHRSYKLPPTMWKGGLVQHHNRPNEKVTSETSCQLFVEEPQQSWWNKSPPVKSLKGCVCNWIVCLINRCGRKWLKNKSCG